MAKKEEKSLVQKVTDAYRSKDTVPHEAIEKLGGEVLGAAADVATTAIENKPKKETSTPDPKDEIKVDLDKGFGIGSMTSSSTPRFDINSPSGTTPLYKKSPMKYNAALVGAVSRAYASQGNMFTEKAMENLTEPIFGAISKIADETADAAQKAGALNATMSSKIEGLDSLHPKMTETILKLQNEANQAEVNAGKFLQSGVNRQKSLQDIQIVGKKLDTLIEVDEHIQSLQAHALENKLNRSKSLNKENEILWNQIASGNIWNMLSYNEETGSMMIQNPMGGQDDLMDIRDLDIMPTFDVKYLDNDSKTKKQMKQFASGGKYTREEAELEAKVMTKKLFATHGGDDMYDDPDFDEFAKILYGNPDIEPTGEKWIDDANDVLMQGAGSEFFEAHTIFGDDDDRSEDLRRETLINGMKSVDLSESFMEFKTKKLMEAYDNVVIQKETEESNAGNIGDKEKTYPVYTYNTEGTYMGATQKTADDVRSMFDIDSGDFSFGKRRVKVNTGSKGNRTWQIYDISGTQQTGKIYYKLEDVLNDFAPYAAKTTTSKLP